VKGAGGEKKSCHAKEDRVSERAAHLFLR
jgi:hypothetical protein